MKARKLIFTLFLVVGILFLVGAVWSFSSGMDFAKKGIETQGQIIDLEVSISDDKSKSYFPIIRFMTSNNEEIVFRSTAGGSSYRGSIGQEIDVIYDPQKPNNAMINSTSVIYGFSIIFGIFGVLFTLVGGIPVLYGMLKRGNNKKLLREGSPIQVKITDVIKNEMIKINNNSPYQIIADAHDKSTNTIKRYQSANIYFDPSPYIDREMVTIYIDKKNGKKYYMDISFLPELK